MKTERLGDIELRFRNNGDLDEIVIPGKLHLERLSPQQIWIGLYHQDEERVVHLFSPAGVKMTTETNEGEL